MIGVERVQSVTVAKFKREHVSLPAQGMMPATTTSKLVRDGTLTASIILSIDMDRLFALLGPKAISSKLGKSMIAGGIIKARVVGSIEHKP